jgi:hypothetical protein
VLYVAATPGSGGDGSRQNPFHDLGSAFRASEGDPIMALGKGTHTIAATFPESVTLWGACAEATHLVAGFEDDVTGTVTAHGGATVQLRNVHVRGPTPGLRVQGGASMDVRNVVVSGTGIAGVWVLDGSTFTARSLVVRDTEGHPTMGFGRALNVSGGSRAVVRTGAFERTQDIAVFAADPQSELVLEDVAIRDTRPNRLDDAFGRAVEVSLGASAVFERLAIESNHEYGLFVADADTHVTLQDSVVRGTRSRDSDGKAGRGLHVQKGARLEATRVLVDDNRELGVYASGDGGMLKLEDVAVVGTRRRPADDFGGRAIQIQWGAHLDARRVMMHDNESYGAFIATENASATFSDLSVLATGAQPALDRLFGRALELIEGAQVELTRARITGNRDVSIRASGADTKLTVQHLDIANTRPLKQRFGRGLEITGGAELRGSRVRVRDNLDIGIHARGGDVRLQHVTVERTGEAPCAGSSCRASGFGLTAVGGATVHVRTFRVARNALAGVLWERGSMLQLRDGRLSGHPIGVHSGVKGSEYRDSLIDVTFHDNEQNVDATMLPVPEPVAPGERTFE